MAFAETSFGKRCRICSARSDGIPIYGDEGRQSCLEEKMKLFLLIQVSEQDFLPKTVCRLCKTKLDGISNFAAMATRTQTRLLDSWSRRKELSASSGEEDEDESWWSHKGDNLKNDSSTESASDPGESSSPSLLHSILTKGTPTTGLDVTEMEVTVDPMLFFEEDEEDVTNGTNQPSDGSPGIEESGCQEQLKPYQCYLCPRGFNTDFSLKSHLWNHVPPRKLLVNSPFNRSQSERSLRQRMYNSQCLCQVCGRVYPSKSTLRAHQITHSNLRPHKCSLCEKTFKRNQDLKFHINQHTGERPYRCPYCPKAFASSGNCFSHRKRMHPKQLAKDKSKGKR